RRVAGHHGPHAARGGGVASRELRGHRPRLARAADDGAAPRPPRSGGPRGALRGGRRAGPFLAGGRAAPDERAWAPAHSSRRAVRGGGRGLLVRLLERLGVTMSGMDFDTAVKLDIYQTLA